MPMEVKRLVTIKGTRDGLTLYLDDTCSFDDLLNELAITLANDQLENQGPMATVNVQLGNRYIHTEQEKRLHEVIRENTVLMVEKIEANVVTKKEALKWLENSEVKVITKIIRSGQVVEVEGDMLLLGDVNAGGKIIASGNIFVMGILRGVAHAGSKGNEDAVIAASFMQPSQLRIANYISRSPDYETKETYMECGLVDKESSNIIIERLQSVVNKRPDLNSFRRRMING